MFWIDKGRSNWPNIDSCVATPAQQPLDQQLQPMVTVLICVFQQQRSSQLSEHNSTAGRIPTPTLNVLMRESVQLFSFSQLVELKMLSHIWPALLYSKKGQRCYPPTALLMWTTSTPITPTYLNYTKVSYFLVYKRFLGRLITLFEIQFSAQEFTKTIVVIPTSFI